MAEISRFDDLFFPLVPVLSEDESSELVTTQAKQKHKKLKFVEKSLPYKDYDSRVPVLTENQIFEYSTTGIMPKLDNPTFIYNCRYHGCLGYVVKDDSMAPRLPKDSTILISPVIKPVPGNVVAAILEQPDSPQKKLVIRRYRIQQLRKDFTEVFELIAENPDYPSFNAEFNSCCRILGRVIGSFTRFP